ncbi:1-aminocyclopropane-1-carboxylate deaminase/D-cysteine desulfhydrase [Microbulbifer sp. ZKSA002]|uniref:1-aminocyclopropane-1-carboxylate deaminase/D-cysteine desulfhydrase n=1 Tax=Microbulbifer sp. ZKSA002 TaxID=3243388 RepID=UPI00403A6B77
MSGYIGCVEVDAFAMLALKVPYQRVASVFFPGIDLWVRRDDLLDPLISGNKAYKLIPNLAEAGRRGLNHVVTCGGAWSNHIHATAAAGARFGVNVVGIIRGERSDSLSATLEDARRFGMDLCFVSRDQYRRRKLPCFLDEVGIDVNKTLFVPEGGANIWGVHGGRLLGRVVNQSSPVKFDQVWTACGTGTTFSGLAAGLQEGLLVGVEVLKAGTSISTDFSRWQCQMGRAADAAVRGGGRELRNFECSGVARSTLLNGFHCGGYAKRPEYLQKFQSDMEKETGLPLDPIYTSKLFLALSQCVMKGWVPRGSKVLVLHSGGLQGRRGYP